VPAHWRTLEGITLHYLSELKSVAFASRPHSNGASSL
jgi:hypothetical protein